nr:MAG TPA: hypothetical protein [Caudoviricetes sp.]
MPQFSCGGLTEGQAINLIAAVVIGKDEAGRLLRGGCGLSEARV